MFAEGWELRRSETKEVASRMKLDAGALQQKIDRLLDRLVDADTGSMISAYETRIERLQHYKR